MSGRARGRVLYKLADLVEQNAQELATLESLDNGKPFQTALQADVALVCPSGPPPFKGQNFPLWLLLLLSCHILISSCSSLLSFCTFSPLLL